jgi:OOP family OmpA-OmpF porin
MKTNHALKLICAAGAAALSATAAVGQDATYFYGGASVGQSRAKIDDTRLTNSQIGAGLTTTAITHDERDTAFKVFGGYQFHPNWALELGYFNLGKFGFTSTTLPPGTLSGQLKVQGANLDLVGTLPLSENWSALGRIGAAYAKTRDTFSGTGAVVVADPNPKKSETNYKVGVGLQYAITPSMLLRGEAERYRVNDGIGGRNGVNMLSVGLVFPFGRSPAPAPHVAQAEPAPQPAPEPAPMVAAAPPPPPPAAPPRKRVSFSAESLFGFDKSDVTPEGKTALDTFAKETVGTTFDTISVEGHADRIGSPTYNQTLSQERADSVRSYLISAGQIDGQRITATGKGETEPVTKPEDCKGNKRSAKLIACLQPDRRVDIEVVGTR